MIISAENNFDAFQKVIALIQEDLDKAKEKANDVLPSVMLIGGWPETSRYSFKQGDMTVYLSNTSNWFMHNTYYYGNKPIEDAASLDKRKAELISLVDKLESDIARVVSDNLPAIKNNKKIREKITLLMNHIGITQSYSTWEYKTSRSKTKTQSKHRAGYVDDLDRCVPVTIRGVKPDVTHFRKTIEQKYQVELERIKKVERDREAAEEAKIRSHTEALLRAKYTPDNALSTKFDILQAILKKDKYLHLAYYLEMNRGDWNDGYSYAEMGLDGFNVVTDLDKEIVEEIQGLIDNWDHDGRVFRDCTYNYGYLYGLVEDQQLVDDLKFLMEFS